MPYLTKLSFVKEQTRTPKNPIKARQQKLIERLTEQIEMVQAMIDKKPFVRYHTIWVTDEETGEQVKNSFHVRYGSGTGKMMVSGIFNVAMAVRNYPLKTV